MRLCKNLETWTRHRSLQCFSSWAHDGELVVIDVNGQWTYDISQDRTRATTEACSRGMSNS